MVTASESAGLDGGVVDIARPPLALTQTADNADASAPIPTTPPVNLRGVVTSPGLRRVQVGAQPRTYLLHAPPSLEPGKPAPLVFVHHGFTQNGQNMADLTSWKEIADREGILVAFPDGNMALGPLSSPWNVGFPVCFVGSLVTNVLQDDFAFVEEMIADIEAVHPIDREHIFTTGFSMGGYFSNHIGCQRSDLIRGIAPHSSGTYRAECADYKPIPVLLLHGVADQLIVYGCGLEARDLWIERNGCSREVERVQNVRGGTCEYYAGCKAPVGFCSFPLMAHGIAGAGGLFSPVLYAGGEYNENAAELTYRFWRENW